jgi:hypothetical protein
VAELEPVGVRSRSHRVLRMMFLGVVVPMALIVLVFVAYMIWYVGIEHY